MIQQSEPMSTLQAITMIDKDQFAACTIGGVINVLNTAMAYVGGTEIKRECTSLAYYMIPMNPPIPAIVCGVSIPEEAGEFKYGIMIVAGSDKQIVPVYFGSDHVTLVSQELHYRSTGAGQRDILEQSGWYQILCLVTPYARSRNPAGLHLRRQQAHFRLHRSTYGGAEAGENILAALRQQPSLRRLRVAPRHLGPQHPCQHL